MNITREMGSNLSWAEFEHLINAETLESKNEQVAQCYHERLALLTYVQEKFKQFGSLKNMPIGDQRIIAGVCEFSNPEHPYFGWFGTLRAIGRMKGYFNANKPTQEQAVIISDALDFIPLTGRISKEAFDNYIQKFNEVSTGKNPNMVSSYYRFLTMKSPDFFIALNGENNDNLTSLYGIVKKPTPERYWGFLNLAKESNWYKNGDVNSPIWQYRMEFLDGICYNYTKYTATP